MTAKRDPQPKPAKDEQTPATELQRRFGENFRAARLAAGLNQREVSARSGVHQEEVSKIERGMVNLTLRTMERLAQVVDHGADHLLQLNPTSKPIRRP